MMIKTGMDMSAQARVHSETLRELGNSFETEVSSMVVDIEGTQVTLTGTLDKQFDDWRRILREIYAAETGIPVPPDDSGSSAQEAPSAAPPSSTKD